jgi:integrase
MLQDFINDIRDQGHKVLPARVRDTMKLVLRHAVERDWLVRSPLTDKPIEAPPTKARISVPSREELRTYLDVIAARQLGERASTNLNRRVAFSLMLYAGGQRRSEVCGLQWEDVDWIKSEINIRHSFTRSDGLSDWTKTPSGTRLVRMIPEVREPLSELWEVRGRPKTGFVLLTDGGKPFYDSIYLVFRRTMVTAGLADARGKNLWSIMLCDTQQRPC